MPQLNEQVEVKTGLTQRKRYPSAQPPAQPACKPDPDADFIYGPCLSAYKWFAGSAASMVIFLTARMYTQQNWDPFQVDYFVLYAAIVVMLALAQHQIGVYVKGVNAPRSTAALLGWPVVGGIGLFGFLLTSLFVHIFIEWKSGRHGYL